MDPQQNPHRDVTAASILLSILNTFCDVFIFDETEFSTQVKHGGCWLVSLQQLPPVGSFCGTAAPEAYREKIM